MDNTEGKGITSPHAAVTHKLLLVQLPYLRLNACKATRCPHSPTEVSITCVEARLDDIVKFGADHMHRTFEEHGPCYNPLQARSTFFGHGA